MTATGRVRSLAAAILALAAALPVHATESAEGIAKAFEEKGMPPERSRCYGETITANLARERHGEAVTLVASAGGANEIAEGVKAGGLEMVQAFMAAEAACGR